MLSGLLASAKHSSMAWVGNGEDDMMQERHLNKGIGIVRWRRGNFVANVYLTEQFSSCLTKNESK